MNINSRNYLCRMLTYSERDTRCYEHHIFCEGMACPAIIRTYCICWLSVDGGVHTNSKAMCSAAVRDIQRGNKTKVVASYLSCMLVYMYICIHVRLFAGGRLLFLSRLTCLCALYKYNSLRMGTEQFN